MFKSKKITSLLVFFSYIFSSFSSSHFHSILFILLILFLTLFPCPPPFLPPHLIKAASLHYNCAYANAAFSYQRKKGLSFGKKFLFRSREALLIRISTRSGLFDWKSYGIVEHSKCLLTGSFGRSFSCSAYSFTLTDHSFIPSALSFAWLACCFTRSQLQSPPS